MSLHVSQIHPLSLWLANCAPHLPSIVYALPIYQFFHLLNAVESFFARGQRNIMILPKILTALVNCITLVKYRHFVMNNFTKKVCPVLRLPLPGQLKGKGCTI